MRPRGKVLVVDDDRDFSDSTRDLLEHVNYECEVAYGSDQAREILTGNPARFDVILIDMYIEQPDSGLRLLQHVVDSGVQSTPVMITGLALSDVQMAVECMKKGAYDYLLKGTPFQADLIILAVGRACEHQRYKHAIPRAIEEVRTALGHVEERMDDLEAVVSATNMV